MRITHSLRRCAPSLKHVAELATMLRGPAIRLTISGSIHSSPLPQISGLARGRTQVTVELLYAV